MSQTKYNILRIGNIGAIVRSLLVQTVVCYLEIPSHCLNQSLSKAKSYIWNYYKRYLQGNQSLRCEDRVITVQQSHYHGWWSPGSLCHQDISTHDIINEFNKLNKWCISNKLTLNAKKTNFILFHTANKTIPNNFSEITTVFMKIKRVNRFKYLRITLDETLNRSEHVSILCESLLKYFGIFNHSKYKVTAKIARQIYYAII